VPRPLPRRDGPHDHDDSGDPERGERQAKHGYRGTRTSFCRLRTEAGTGCPGWV